MELVSVLGGGDFNERTRIYTGISLGRMASGRQWGSEELLGEWLGALSI